MSESRADKNVGDKSVSAIFVFGDSTSDPGNNFIGTSFKSNFPPYGKDFTNHTATGRFNNGLLANDFIARYVGVKDYVPPYLDPSLDIQELATGVSFAPAGSGFDPLTPTISNVMRTGMAMRILVKTGMVMRVPNPMKTMMSVMAHVSHDEPRIRG